MKLDYYINDKIIIKYKKIAKEEDLIVSNTLKEPKNNESITNRIWNVRIFLYLIWVKLK